MSVLDSRSSGLRYERHGAANLFLSIEPLRLLAQRTRQRRTRKDFGEHLRWLAEQVYPEAERIALVLDNLNTHNPGSHMRSFAPEEAARLAKRFEWHYTP